jgi:hypothetical protein
VPTGICPKSWVAKLALRRAGGDEVPFPVQLRQQLIVNRTPDPGEVAFCGVRGSRAGACSS